MKRYLYLSLATCSLVATNALADGVVTDSVKTSWDRSFYMQEPKARLKVSSSVSTVLCCELKALGQEQVLQRRQLKLDASREGSVEFDLKNIKPGNYYVSIKGGQDKSFAASNASLTKLPYKAGAVQYTDEGVLLRDGAPIFPVGMYYIRPYANPEFLAGYSAAKFNTQILEWQDAAAGIAEVNAQKALGIAPIVGIQNSAEVRATPYDPKQPAPQEKWVAATKTLIAQTSEKAGDNILAWKTWDEPPLGEWLDLTRALHKAVKEVDPYHPTMVDLNNPDYFAAYADGATDILATDPYPYFDPRIPQPVYPITRVSDYVKAAVAAVDGKRPVIAILQSFYEEWGRMPTPNELRCMTYLSIVHGAKGIVYFSYDYRPGPMATTHPETWKALRDLATELHTTGPIALSSSPRGVSVIKTGGTSVDCKLFFHQGLWYLMAVNSANAPAGDVGFTIQGLKGPVQIETMFENRSAIQPKASWNDKFATYATHLYKITPQK